MERITIFTSAYNRAAYLERAFDALRQQSCKDFCWMIIDDGSTDNTKEVVQLLMKRDAGFRIIYIPKQNEGMYSCYNVAIEYATTELMYSIDSDDWIAEDAVKKILEYWDSCEDRLMYQGIVGYTCLENGQVIGTKLPNEYSINSIDYTSGRKKGYYGDRGVVFRTDLLKKYGPMKKFRGEKDFNPAYLDWKISENYDFLVLNECLMYKEYQEDGMSAKLFRQYANSPNSFAEMRRLFIDMEDIPIPFLLRQAIHYVSSCIFAKKLGLIWRGTRRPGLCTICLLPGIILNLYIRYRNRFNKDNKILRA